MANLSSKLGPMLYVFPFQNVQGALVTEAELFYLRHVRTCAASTFGHRCTCSGGTPCRCISGLPLIRLLIMSLVKVVLQSMPSVLTFAMSMFVKVLQSTLQVLQLLMSMCTAVLESMLSPLEMCACIVVVDVSDSGSVQRCLAVTSLLLAVCGWHVPPFISYHNVICRLLSAICTQALLPHSPALICLAFLYPTFGKRQSAPTSAPESRVGALEHASPSAGDNISLDGVIAILRAAGKEDTRGKEILAAAITLRDSRGRDRKEALRKMANPWGVTLKDKVDGKWQRRSNAALAEDIQASVCKAALDWKSWAEPSQSSDARYPSRADAEAVLKRTRNTGAAEQNAAMATPAGATVHQLPESSDDVLPNTLSRLAPNMYQATLRSGTIWRGDAGLLSSLPQGEARLATLQMRERLAEAKA